MSKFTVTYLPNNHLELQPSVDIVEADYYRVEGGALVFRTYARQGHDNGYPHTVHTFAAGVWAEVEDFHD